MLPKALHIVFPLDVLLTVSTSPFPFSSWGISSPDVSGDSELGKRLEVVRMLVQKWQVAFSSVL